VLADERDQPFERVVLRPDPGAFERPVGEVRLERLDEAPLSLRREVALDRLRSGDCASRGSPSASTNATALLVVPKSIPTQVTEVTKGTGSRREAEKRRTNGKHHWILS
jgi:hypothetical protein